MEFDENTRICPSPLSEKITTYLLRSWEVAIFQANSIVCYRGDLSP